MHKKFFRTFVALLIVSLLHGFSCRVAAMLEDLDNPIGRYIFASTNRHSQPPTHLWSYNENKMEFGLTDGGIKELNEQHQESHIQATKNVQSIHAKFDGSTAFKPTQYLVRNKNNTKWEWTKIGDGPACEFCVDVINGLKTPTPTSNKIYWKTTSNPQIQYKMQGQNFPNQQSFNAPPNPMPIPKRNDFSNQQDFNTKFLPVPQQIPPSKRNGFSNQQDFNPPPNPMPVPIMNQMPVHGGNLYPQIQYENQGQNFPNQQPFNPPPKRKEFERHPHLNPVIRNDFEHQGDFYPQTKDETPWPKKHTNWVRPSDYNSTFQDVFEYEVTQNKCANLACDFKLVDGGYYQGTRLEKQEIGYSETSRGTVHHYQDVFVPYTSKNSDYWICSRCKSRNTGLPPKISFKEQNDNSFSSDGKTRVMDIDLPIINGGGDMCSKSNLDGKLLTIWNRAGFLRYDDWSGSLEKMWRASRQLDVEVYGEDLKGITYNVKSSHCAIF
jgi:hypothetical protein